MFIELLPSNSCLLKSICHNTINKNRPKVGGKYWRTVKPEGSQTGQSIMYVVMSYMGLRTDNHYAGEDQQQFSSQLVVSGKYFLRVVNNFCSTIYFCLFLVTRTDVGK
jgi:hypothetical protein